jgi:hypothetical protein
MPDDESYMQEQLDNDTNGVGLDGVRSMRGRESDIQEQQDNDSNDGMSDALAGLGYAIRNLKQ